MEQRFSRVPPTTKLPTFSMEKGTQLILQSTTKDYPHRFPLIELGKSTNGIMY